jgi:nickel/cobalt transporter (NiCoT) family protein
MLASMKTPPARGLKTRLFLVGGAIFLLNLFAWTAAIAAFHDKPALLGLALLIYGLGLRHAVDADHIAAIDNVTRKLMQMNLRPVGVGFFFALGHSAVVVIVVALVVRATGMLDKIHGFQEIGGTLSTAISALFLFAIAAMNFLIFLGVYKSFRRLRAGDAYVEEDLDVLLNNRGFLSRIFRPVFRLVSQSWHMVLVGFLFGLGFDTATEVAMFGISATQAAKGVAFASILVLPLLFAAGMSLVDTLDGVLMLGAYDWAFVKPIRKLYYNMTITLVSVTVAVVIGGIEVFGLVADQFQLKGGLWDWIGVLNDNFNTLGFAIIGLFVLAWAISFAVYKLKRLDEIEIG